MTLPLAMPVIQNAQFALVILQMIAQDALRGIT